MSPLLIGPLFELVKQALGGLGLDPEAKARAQAQAFDVLTSGSFAEKSEVQLLLAQMEVNKADAGGQSWMQRNWRPAMGWACVASLGYCWLAQPGLQWLAAINGWPAPPGVNTEQQFVIVGQMLGLAAARTVEKLKGAQ